MASRIIAEVDVKILRLLMDGKTHTQVGRILNMGVSNLTNRMARLRNRLGYVSTVQMVADILTKDSHLLHLPTDDEVPRLSPSWAADKRAAVTFGLTTTSSPQLCGERQPDPIDYPATQFQDEGDEYVAWTPPQGERQPCRCDHNLFHSLCRSHGECLLADGTCDCVNGESSR